MWIFSGNQETDGTANGLDGVRELGTEWKCYGRGIIMSPSPHQGSGSMSAQLGEAPLKGTEQMAWQAGRQTEKAKFDKERTMDELIGKLGSESGRCFEASHVVAHFSIPQLPKI